MGLGSRNPLPYPLGGAPSRAQQAYTSLQSMVGEGNFGADGTIEAEWRVAKAHGLGAVMATDERAAFQAFPDTATDFIPVFEELLGLPSPPDETDQERRDTNTTAWTKLIDDAIPALTETLQAIDSRLTIIEPDRANLVTTQFGRVFEPYEPATGQPAFNIYPGDVTFTNFPNYSGDFIVVVKLDISPLITPTTEDQNVFLQVKTLLATDLPSWVDFVVLTDDDGFTLDLDLLDISTL